MEDLPFGHQIDKQILERNLRLSEPVSSEGLLSDFSLGCFTPSVLSFLLPYLLQCLANSLFILEEFEHNMTVYLMSRVLRKIMTRRRAIYLFFKHGSLLSPRL
jgi:hypothetical protein